MRTVAMRLPSVTCPDVLRLETSVQEVWLLVIGMQDLACTKSAKQHLAVALKQYREDMDML